MDKTELRQSMRARVAEITPEQIALFDTQIASSFLKSENLMPQTSVACYMPLKGEVSCKSIIQSLVVKGHKICLPAVIGRELPLIFRQYRPGDVLVRGMMGPLEPHPAENEMIPDIIIIPMMAFNRSKYRLGYGTGFYDRTLEAFRSTKHVRTIGLAFSSQESPDLPIEPHDVALDVIITEKEIIT